MHQVIIRQDQIHGKDFEMRSKKDTTKNEWDEVRIARIKKLPPINKEDIEDLQIDLGLYNKNIEKKRNEKKDSKKKKCGRKKLFRKQGTKKKL